ncbi:hypothetical protein PR048_023758 [Dryococelus australis]|uniref:Uncharacterized protein n=1 Tax=Dryococelus australis TaxID=614101 RepID=A0ABQ9GUZ5_9NEOP|nr:hypothetical protein PR048_023758 [Dryococelus australis]
MDSSHRSIVTAPSYTRSPDILGPVIVDLGMFYIVSGRQRCDVQREQQFDMTSLATFVADNEQLLTSEQRNSCVSGWLRAGLGMCLLIFGAGCTDRERADWHSSSPPLCISRPVIGPGTEWHAGVTQEAKEPRTQKSAGNPAEEVPTGRSGPGRKSSCEGAEVVSRQQTGAGEMGTYSNKAVHGKDRTPFYLVCYETGASANEKLTEALVHKGSVEFSLLPTTLERSLKVIRRDFCLSLYIACCGMLVIGLAAVWQANLPEPIGERRSAPSCWPTSILSSPDSSLSIAIGCCLHEKAFSYSTGPPRIRQHRRGSYVIRVHIVNKSQKVIQPIKAVTNVQPRENDCISTTHKRAARDPLHTSCNVTCRAMFNWWKCKLAGTQLTPAYLATVQHTPLCQGQ